MKTLICLLLLVGVIIGNACAITPEEIIVAIDKGNAVAAKCETAEVCNEVMKAVASDIADLKFKLRSGRSTETPAVHKQLVEHEILMKILHERYSKLFFGRK
jgi:hypothetical protein